MPEKRTPAGRFGRRGGKVASGRRNVGGRALTSAGGWVNRTPHSPRQAPGKGVGYLWVQGAIGGVSFVRSDPVPFNFQPLEVLMLQKQINYAGGVVAVPVRITNLDNRQQCFRGYADSVTVPEGWSFSWTLPPGDDGDFFMSKLDEVLGEGECPGN